MEEIIKNEKSKSHKEFEELLSKDMGSRNFKEGEIISGIVSNIGKKHVFIDIQAKSEGTIPIEEFVLTKEIDKYSEQNFINKNTCIYGDIFAKEFLSTKNFTCFKTYSQLDAAKERPLFAYKNLRNVKRSDPKGCKLIWDETYEYSFYNKKISVGTAWFCP